MEDVQSKDAQSCGIARLRVCVSSLARCVLLPRRAAAASSFLSLF